MVISSLDFIVPIGTVKVYGAGDAGQGPTTFFAAGDQHKVHGTRSKSIRKNFP
jgi:hypothetical protein